MKVHRSDEEQGERSRWASFISTLKLEQLFDQLRLHQVPSIFSFPLVYADIAFNCP